MKKIRLLVPAVGLASMAVVPLAITSCKGNTTRQITADDTVVLTINKNDNDGIEVIVKTKDTTQHVVSVVITMGEHQLTSGEFAFAKIEGKIIIPKEVCSKYSGNVTIKTTNEKKVIIELDRTDFILFTNRTAQIKATASPKGSVVKWKSSNEDIATIDHEGLVTSKNKTGETTITASVGNVSTSIKITVKPEAVLTNAVMATATSETSFEWVIPDDCDGWLQYSFDGENFTNGISGEVIKFGDDGSRQNLYLRGCFENYWHQSGVIRGNHLTFKKGMLNDKATVKISGSVMNFLQETPGVIGTKMPEHAAFAFLFHLSDAIVEVDDNFLPADELQPQCYYGMFSYCQALEKAPTLPATKLAEECYHSMFQQTWSLKTPPVLACQDLAKGCYYQMFERSGLTEMPALPATTLVAHCYHDMFKGCKSITTTPNIAIDKFDDSSCFSMFDDCEGLLTQKITTTATELPDNACAAMFRGCEKLQAAPSLNTITKINESSCDQMFMGCKALTTAPSQLPAPEADFCYRQMFYGCEKLTKAPTFLTSTGTYCGNQCCYSMFQDCYELTDIPAELPATTLGERCYSYMFAYCKALKKAPKLPATALTVRCYESMFLGCTNLKIAEETGGTGTLFFTCPAEGLLADSCVVDMFKNTGGSFTTGTPEATKKYYYE